MKRKVSRAVLMVACALVLVAGACASAAGTITLRLSMFPDMSPPVVELVKQQVEAFNAANDQIHVEMTIEPEFWIKIGAHFAAGVSPDIIPNTFTETTNRFADKGMYVPLDTYIASSKTVKYEDFVDLVWDTCKYQGKTYVIPYSMTTIALVYNKDMFDEAKLAYPNDNWTWDDFLAAAKALTKSRGGRKQFGFVTNEENWPLTSLIPLIISNGGEIVNKTKTQFLFNGPKAIEALQFYTDLVNKYRVAPNAAERGGIPDVFAAGMAAMKIDRTYVIYTTKQKAPNIRVGVAAIPRPKNGRTVSYLEGIAFGISTQSKYPDAAWKFIEFITSEQSQEKMAQLQIYIPTRKRVLDRMEKSDAFAGFVNQLGPARGVAEQAALVDQFDYLVFPLVSWMEKATSGFETVDVKKTIDAIVKEQSAILPGK